MLEPEALYKLKRDAIDRLLNSIEEMPAFMRRQGEIIERKEISELIMQELERIEIEMFERTTIADQETHVGEVYPSE